MIDLPTLALALWLSWQTMFILFAALTQWELKKVILMAATWAVILTVFAYWLASCGVFDVPRA